MKHIIIPLIMKSTHQCKECQRHFISAEILKTHTLQHHNKIIINPEHKNNNIKAKIPEILRSIVEKQVFVQCENDINVLVNNKLSHDTKHKAKSDSKMTHGPVNDNKMTNPSYTVSQNDNETKKDNINGKLNVKEEPLSPKFIKERISSPIDDEKESIRHRLLFEEDIEDTLFRDISNECQVNIETLCQEVSFDFDDALEVSDSDDTMSLEIKDETNNFSNRMNNSESGMNNFSNMMNNSQNRMSNFGNGINYCESDMNNFEYEIICPDSEINVKDNTIDFKNRIISSADGNNFENGINNSDNETNNSEDDINNFKNGIGNIQINENGIHFEMLHNMSENRKMQFEKAIHCDVLMRPDISVCKFCGKEFPNRYVFKFYEECDTDNS